jgi:hypothetical protein
MKKRIKDIVLNVIGAFLIAAPIIRMFFLQGYETLPQFFWLCNHVPILMGLAILFRSSFWLTAEFSLLFAGMLLWVVDFLAYFLFGIILFDSAMYIFNSAGTMFFYLSAIVHLLALPLAIIAIFLLKKQEPWAWKGSLLHALILMPIAAYMGSSYNINFFLKPSTSLIPDFSLYPLVITILYFGLFVIPTNLLVARLLKTRKNR